MSPLRRWLTGSFNNEFPLIALIAGLLAGNGRLMAATWRVCKIPSITHSSVLQLLVLVIMLVPVLGLTVSAFLLLVFVLVLDYIHTLYIICSASANTSDDTL